MSPRGSRSETLTVGESTAAERSFTCTLRSSVVPAGYATVAAVRALEKAIGRKAGGSTGTGLWSALKIVAEMVAAGEQGSVVTEVG